MKAGFAKEQRSSQTRPEIALDESLLFPAGRLDALLAAMVVTFWPFDILFPAVVVLTIIFISIIIIPVLGKERIPC